MLTEEQYNYCLARIKTIVPESAAEDVLHEILLQVMESGVVIDDIPAYIISSAYRSYYSRTSPYARKYKPMIQGDIDLTRLSDVLPEDYDVDEFDCYAVDIVKEIDNFDGACWWEKEAVKRKILENKTFKELAVEYNIKESQIQYSFYKTVKKLKKHILEKYGK